MKISIPQLGRSYDVPGKILNPYTQAEMAKALPKLRGRTLFVDFQKDIDGPQTAARLVRETLGGFGVSWVTASSQAEAIIWIQGSSAVMRFAFVVAHPEDTKKFIAAECGPRELTATIMTGICEYFTPIAMRTPSVRVQEVAKLLTVLDQAVDKDLQEIQSNLVSLGEQAIDAILQSIGEINGRLLRAEDPEANMTALERRVVVLGKARSARGIKAVLDALADSAGTVNVLKRQIDELHALYTNPNSNPIYCHDMLFLVMGRQVTAKSLRDASENALVSIGDPVLPYINKYLPNSSAVVQKRLKKVASRIRKQWWQFWK